MDKNLNLIEPTLPSDRYSAFIFITVFVENRSVTPTQIDVGVRYEPLIIIIVYDATLGVEKPICEMSVGFGNQVLDLEPMRKLGSSM